MTNDKSIMDLITQKSKLIQKQEKIQEDIQAVNRVLELFGYNEHVAIIDVKPIDSTLYIKKTSWEDKCFAILKTLGKAYAKEVGENLAKIEPHIAGKANRIATHYLSALYSKKKILKVGSKGKSYLYSVKQ